MDAMTSDPSWYVIYTTTRSERRIAEKIQTLGFETFVPLERRRRYRMYQKFHEYHVALFPRYAFVRFSADDERWIGILQIDGVNDLLHRRDGELLPVQDEKIDALREAMHVGFFDRTRAKIGTKVQILTGPFSGTIARIRRTRAGDRMEILFNFLGSEQRMVVRERNLREVETV